MSILRRVPEVTKRAPSTTRRASRWWSWGQPLLHGDQALTQAVFRCPTLWANRHEVAVAVEWLRTHERAWTYGRVPEFHIDDKYPHCLEWAHEVGAPPPSRDAFRAAVLGVTPSVPQPYRSVP